VVGFQLSQLHDAQNSNEDRARAEASFYRREGARILMQAQESMDEMHQKFNQQKHSHAVKQKCLKSELQELRRKLLSAPHALQHAHQRISSERAASAERVAAFLRSLRG